MEADRYDNEGKGSSPYREQLFSGIPLYSTRLVREADFPFKEREQVDTPEGIAVVLQEYFEGRDREEFVVCLLDTANTLIGMSSISVGGLAVSIVEPRQVFKVAVLANAGAIIVAHQHPSGNPEPSREDIKVTVTIQQVAGRGGGDGLRSNAYLSPVDDRTLPDR